MSGGVFELGPAQVATLRKALDAAGYDFRRLQHAHFQARGEGVVVSCYRSGKLVVQGKGAAAFQSRYLERAREAAPKGTKASDGPMPSAADSLGSDEAGKGDTFGGLVVAAVHVPADKVEELAATGVADSKTMTDGRIRELAPWLREHFDFEIRDLHAGSYNRERASVGANVNKLLAKLHVDCLQALQQRAGAQVAVVDRFAASAPVAAALKTRVPGLVVHEVPRAERHAAVAAASVLARAAFLEQIAALDEQLAIDVPLGSGTPVGKALRRLVEVHGLEVLEEARLTEAVKTHFKNVEAFRQSR